jgi:RNA polymerase sigma factor (sigma-70 family)
VYRPPFPLGKGHHHALLEISRFAAYATSRMSDVTRILSEIDAGNLASAARLLPLVYDELRRLAAARLANEKPGQTLSATALVHEAYLRLVGPEAMPEVTSQKSDKEDPTSDLRPPTAANWNSRGHFFGAAAEAMRRILIDAARRKNAIKRGGPREKAELADVATFDDQNRIDLLALDDALTELTRTDAQAAELVKLRYFAGLSSADAAQVLGISPRTADRTWLYARTWLRNKLDSP